MQAKQCSTSKVLVIGAQGVLGGLLAQEFKTARWAVVRSGRRPDPGAGFRHVDLDEPETVAAAIGDADVVVNTVPDPGLTTGFGHVCHVPDVAHRRLLARRAHGAVGAYSAGHG